VIGVRSLPGRPNLPERVVHRLRRDASLVAMDFAIVLAAYLLPLVLRFDGTVPSTFWRGFWTFAAVAVVIHLLVNYFFGLYGQMWRFASIEEARRLLLAGAAAAAAVIVVDVLWVYPAHLIPLSVVLFGGMLAVGAFGAIRFQARLFGYRRRETEAAAPRRVLIMGAGRAAAMLLQDIREHPEVGLEPVGIVDDARRKFGASLRGINVMGSRAAIPALVERLRVDEVLLAIPSATSELVQDVSTLCERANVALRSLPSRAEIVGGKVTVRDIRDISIEDLLGRQQVETNLGVVFGMLRGRRVLVTGAGGSIGSEIARQVAAFSPSKLVLLDHDETHLYELSLGMDPASAGVPTDYVLADIRDRDRMLAVYAAHAPDVVFHAAAHKHVPLLESHPEEALATNVLGTANVADAAIASGVERFVMISTDKAINTTNVMGASKWLAEQVVRNLDGGETKFCSVRFGNVLGSRGSVIPTFLQQIRNGGPVTVTDPFMARYFMSTREAVQLVLQAGAVSTGGEVFTLEMGEPVNILDLARRLIRLSGRTPDRDVEIKIVGARPGEKLVEEIVDLTDDPMPSPHPGIRAARPPRPSSAKIRSSVRALQRLADAGLVEELAAHMKSVARAGFNAHPNGTVTSSNAHGDGHLDGQPTGSNGHSDGQLKVQIRLFDTVEASPSPVEESQ
jgi:FlaA1/EpsC-like NDP-sugar epimerase